MLTPEQLQKLPDNLIRLYAQLEADIIADMAGRINAMDLFIPAADWQFQKAIEMGNTYQMILKRLSGAAGKTEQEIEELMTIAASESLKYDDSVHKQAGKDLTALNQSAALLATLNAGIKRTKGYFENLCRTTANQGSRQFSDALDRAHMQVVSGAFSKDEAIKFAVKDLAKQGISAAEYKNGRKMSLESAVRMNLVTGINQTCAELQLQRADEAECDLVAVSAHAGARPSHAEWQGKIFSRSGKHKKYPDFVSSTGYGTVTGLCGANCRHTFYPFYEGISVNAYSQKELDEMNRKKVKYNGQMLTEYEASQIQRKIERNIRRFKREKQAFEAVGQSSAESTAKLKYWRDSMNGFIKQTGFKRQYSREEIFPGRKRTVIPEFIPVKGLGTSADDKAIAAYIQSDLNMIPEKHRKLLDDYVKEIEVVAGRSGSYNRATKVMSIPREAIEEPGVVIHELAHALETKLDLYHDGKFIDVLNNGLETVSPFAVITDSETFEKPIQYLDIENGKFITQYQKRVYDEDYEGNERINYSDFTFNVKTLLEYFAEGYRYYCMWPEQLKDKDLLLYQFIEELGHDE